MEDNRNNGIVSSPSFQELSADLPTAWLLFELDLLSSAASPPQHLEVSHG
ncbi:MAG TPA: hypothetical protein VL242_07685 [Sorangium sp.]|nr:hypothetical protein [Sorangium sp.]